MVSQIEELVKSSDALYNSITSEFSQQSTKKYNDEKFNLEQLDAWRNRELPQTLASRYEQTKQAWLTRDELVLLMDWKLAKGTFRPTLPKLIKSNSAEDVKDVTTRGFQLLVDFFSEHSDDKLWWKNATTTDLEHYTALIKKVFKVFCELRGVGPATASLISSLTVKIDPQFTPPFFSDESFLYYVVDAKRPGTKIKYNVKEYTDELLPVYYDILEQVPESSMDTLEKGAWALKTYDIYRVDKLANIKYEGSEEFLNKYNQDQKAKEEKEEPEKEVNGKVKKESKKESTGDKKEKKEAKPEKRKRGLDGLKPKRVKKE